MLLSFINGNASLRISLNQRPHDHDYIFNYVKLGTRRYIINFSFLDNKYHPSFHIVILIVLLVILL